VLGRELLNGRLRVPAAELNLVVQALVAVGQQVVIADHSCCRWLALCPKSSPWRMFLTLPIARVCTPAWCSIEMSLLLCLCSMSRIWFFSLVSCCLKRSSFLRQLLPRLQTSILAAALPSARCGTV